MEAAVRVQNVDFKYGTNSILRNFCARIDYAQIYSLLGPSGGGKTTLLKLILGRLKVQQGSISVLGMSPGQANSCISYMPQESGLCSNFSINQTLRYFKLVYQISNEEFYLRRKALSKLVNLPSRHRLVCQLSGGTKRRLSIAVALINNPSLVILDEPTVGIDALLRNQIWQYLVERLRKGMTIVIVTHYIEEAANSDRVGFMRNGHLLAEDNPKRLLNIFQAPDLEAVFLKLCHIEDNQKDQTKVPSDFTDYSSSQVRNDERKFYRRHSAKPTYAARAPIAGHRDMDNSQQIFVVSHFDPINRRNESNSKINSRNSSQSNDFAFQLLKVKFWILFSLVYRNINKFFYSYFSLIIILLPATQALIYCLAVSRDVVKLKAAIFDQESEPGYGNDFINQLKQVRRYSIEPVKYSSMESALVAIQNRAVLGAVWIPANYTESIDARLEDAFSADNETIQDSTIRLFMDNSMYIDSLEFANVLLESFQHFAKSISHAKDMQALEYPIDIEWTEKSQDFRFSDYYMPGYFLLFIYISQITFASLTLTQERKDGLFERSLIAGVSHELVFLSHIITGCIISIIQIELLHLTAFVLFDNTNHGPFWLAFVFFLVQSFSAMSLGFVISALIDNEIACLILVWFITIPQILSSGVFWPLESIKRPLNYIFYLWPLSIPVQTIRHIMLQGWDLSNAYVRQGFLSSLIPMMFFLCTALLIFKRK